MLALEGDTVLVVEVKTTADPHASRLALRVGHAQRQRLWRTARYLECLPELAGRCVRVDVLVVVRLARGHDVLRVRDLFADGRPR